MLPVVAIVGPTASGKSGLAVDLALRCRGEVVNADSMQLYRGMDVGTAKIAVADRAGVPHHLLDVLDVTQTASVAEFQQWARERIVDCVGRQQVPVLTGGSALYVRAVVDRFEFPGTSPLLRERLERDLHALGARALHERLRAQDPLAASQILPGNTRRVVRALEVVALTGKPFVASLPAHDFVHEPTVLIGLDVPRAVLDDRIERRVHRMWDDGLVEEVRRLEGAGLRAGRTASRALGYAQVLDLLDGHMDEQTAIERIVARTRRFARRQDSWFRKDPRVHWLPYDAPDLLDRALALMPSPGPA